MKFYLSFSLSCIICVSCFTAAEAQSNEQVTATILHLDSAFWKAYNNCDTSDYTKYLTDDVEFYHDKGGITLGAAALIESLEKNLCSNASYKLRREAVAGTVKVYPMANGNNIYGALITGEHLFYVTENGKPEYPDGRANFSQLWLLKDGIWKMARILSYNHHAAEYENKRKEIDVPAAKLDKLTGTYTSAQSGKIDAVRKNTTIVLKTSTSNQAFILYPLSDHLFFTKDRDLTFEFVMGTNGKPLKMIVTENGAKADELTYEK